MSNLGKIFIYEKKPQTLNQYRQHFETNGFFTFGTDNLYLLTQYSKEIHPDIIIINLPSSVVLNSDTMSELEKLLCQNDNCPEIYINYPSGSLNNLKVHQWNFETDELNYKQILSIINDLGKHKIN